MPSKTKVLLTGETASTEYEDILRQVGGFGHNQIRTFLIVSAFETPVAWAMLLPIFAGASSTWLCPTTNSLEGSSILSFNTSQASNVSNTSMNMGEDVCRQANSICPGIQYTAEFTSIKTEWNLVCERDYIPDLITSISMLGVLIGALATGQLADIYGRRKLLFLTYIGLLVFWFASAFSTSWHMYISLRFFVGAFIGGVMVVNFVLPLEFVTPRWRTFCGCIGFWAVGVMSLGLWAYFIRDWRHLTMATAVTGIPLLATWWFVPESPRWLLSRGRVEEAQTILQSMATFNKRPLPDLSSLHSFSQREWFRREEQKHYSYWHLFGSWQRTRKTLILMYGWFVSSSVYYGLSLNVKNLAGDRYLNQFVSGMVELPAVILVVLVNNRLGRRKTTCGLMLLAGVSCGAILVLDLTGKREVYPAAVTALAMLGKFGISGAWAAIQVFSAETFPTVIRNIGVASCSMSARIGGIVAPQFVYISKYSKPIPFAIFGCTALLCAFFAMLLPETTNTPLPDQLQSHDKTNSHVTTSTNGEAPMEDIPLNQDNAVHAILP